jgi:hypothetical protein
MRVGSNHDQSDSALNYSNLSAENQTEFDMALEKDYVDIGDSPGAWGSSDVVFYDGEYYSTSLIIC